MKNLIGKKLLAHSFVQNAIKDSDFKIGAVDREGSIRLFVHGIVGDEFLGLDSLSVSEYLHANKDKPLLVDINSVGGSAFDGLAIFNAIAGHPSETTGIITGEAASAASILFQACDNRIMMANSVQMAHKSNVITVGNASDLRSVASILDKCDECLIATYMETTKLDRETVDAILNGEGKDDGTYMTASDAVEMGFADSIQSLKNGQPAKQNARNAIDQAILHDQSVAIRARAVKVREEMARLMSQN